MFSKSDSDKGGTTIISSSAVIKGTIEDRGEVRIEGEFEGELITGSLLTVGKSGNLKANIKAKEANIGGKIYGNIEVPGRIELQSTSYLRGDIKTGKGMLVIHEGAVFEGNCSMELSKDSNVHIKKQETQPKT